MSAPAVARPFSCEQCSATYVRLAHLRRHERTHSEGRQFMCPFCNSAFARSDAARRHSKTCNQKKGQPVPIPMKRGRKTKACDACASSKRACDGGKPCSSCQTRKHPCVRSRAPPQTENQLVHQSAGQLQFATAAPLRASLSLDFSQFVTPGHTTLRLTFLLHYTDPHNNSLQEYFASSSQKASNLVTPADHGHDLGNSASCFVDIDMGMGSGALDSWIWDLFAQDPSLNFDQDGLTDPLLNAGHASAASSAYPSQELVLRDPYQANTKMQSRLDKIVAALLANSKPENGNDSSNELLKSANQIFTSDKVDLFVQSYFVNWYRHCPILQPSAFNPLKAYAPLLTALMLIGALFSSPESAKAARDCLDAAENYIFEYDAFQQLFNQRPPGSGFPDIAPLQAAFIITIPQHWDNHRKSRNRVRLHRYSDLVSAARHLGLTKLRHSTAWCGSTLPAQTQDSNMALKIEEGIRLTIWIFLVDSSHAIFHRSPPRLTLNEMTGGLPCQEDLFLGLDLGAQQEEISRQALAKVPSIAHGMALLMADKWTDASPAEFGQLNHLDLFILISGLHEIIFNASGACSFACAKPTLREALVRWKVLWDVNIKRLSQVHDSSLGFFQYAEEYWWLAKLFLEESAPKIRGGGELDQDCMGEVNDFIKRFASMSI